MDQEKKTSYLGNPLVKRDGVDHSFTEYEINEYIACQKDPIYFAKNYVKIQTLDEGTKHFDLYPYQEKMYEKFNEERFTVVLSCRQSGKSIATCIYLLWYAIFYPDKNVCILANKFDTAKEMIHRITLSLESLPFFLQPGCKALNKSSILFSNNSKIFCSSSSGNAIRGQSISCLVLDEFAFVNNAETFFTSTFPTISSGKHTKVIITSTPNGINNMFHKIWVGAKQNTNSFYPLEVNWWDVPGRDEKWKKQQISNTSERQFSQEFENSFIGSSDTLITANKLLGLKSEKPSRIDHNEIKYFVEPKEDHEYVMTVDVSQGRGKDYSTFNIIDVTEEPFEQVCVFQDNLISPLIFPVLLYKAGKYYNDAWILVENNDQGCVVVNELYHEYEYENVFVESTVKKNSIGVKMTKRTKKIGCSNLKDIIETDKLKLYDSNTIIELSAFVAKGSSYEASEGNHDDLVMNLVLFSWFVSSEVFGDISSVNLKEMIRREKEQQEDYESIFEGFFDNSKESQVLPKEYYEQQEQLMQWYDN